MPPPSPLSSTIPGNNALPTPSTSSVSSATHQERLEEASKVCARGRELWSQGSRNSKSHGNNNINVNKNSNASLALAEFEYALRLLEPLLGTYHSLTAKTYYWIGFIQKHDPSTYQPALQAFLQTARIRLVLLGPSHESTQEALSAIRWVLQELSLDSNSSKALLQTLYESIRLETLGDIQLRHKNYASALDYYQQASSPPLSPSSTNTTTTTPTISTTSTIATIPTTTLTSSPAYTNAALLLSCTPTLWGKRAFCHSKLQLLNNDNNSNDPDPDYNHHQQLALVGYRHALELFVCTTVHGIHHFDIPQTMERIQGLFLAPSSSSSSSDPHAPMDKAMIHEYCSTRVLKAVVQEYEGKKAMNQGHFINALGHFQVAYQLESPILGESHLVCLKLQQTMDAIRRIVEETPQLVHLITTLHHSQGDLQTQLDDARSTSKPMALSTNDTTTTGDDGGCQSGWTPSQILQLKLNYQTKCQEQEALQKQLTVLQLEQNQWQIKTEHDRLALLELKSRLLQQEQLQLQTTTATNHLLHEQEHRRQEEDAAALTEQLIASQQLTKDLQVQLVTAEQSLSEVTLSRHNAQTKLNTAVVEQNELQARIQQQDLTIRKLQDQLQELQQQQQHDANSHSAETALTSPSKPGKTVYPGTPLSTYSELRPSETQRNLALQLHELQTAQTLEKLQSQNSRAVTTIQALSKELTNLESKYRKLFSKYEKTKVLFRQLESKHSTLKERVRLAEEDKAIVDRQRGRRATAEDSVAANPQPTIIKPRDSPPFHAILRSVRLSQYRYRSSLAHYIVRRPYGMDDSGYFNDASASAYQHQANIMDSTTIQLVAVIPLDQSRLYVTPSTGSIVHHRVDGSSVELSVEPLGWVMLNNDLWYSLDALVEEAVIFREHYCQSVLLNAKPMLWEQRLLQLIGRRSPSVEQWAYRYGSKAYHHHGPLDHPGSWIVVMALLMLLLAMILGQMTMGEETV